MNVMIPPIKEQKEIVSVIKPIEDKIALNTAINENLEQQALAIFKSWFVDFEPFGGVMPDNWTETTLGKIATISTKSINPLKHPKLYLEHYSIPAYDEQHYNKTIIIALDTIGKEVKHVTTEDLRCYFTEYQETKKSSKVTMDNIRRILSSFFSWLEDEDYIIKSPVRRIHKVKTSKTIKETYTDENLEVMRDNCIELRDLAMIDMLASTGMRVGEMVLLNRDDINFTERECVVFGKGDKERMVYFDAREKLHLQNYLQSRTDENPALFVTLRAPHNRLKIGSVELRLRELGRRLGINKVHPHKFRRTLATMAIDKGMPIEQLQRLLGHQRIDTTLQYAMVKQSNVKLAHRKYIG